VRAPRGKAIVPDERFMDVVKHEDRVAWAVSDRNDDAISGLAGAARDVGRRLHTVLADAASRWRCPVYMEETCYLHSEEGGGVETLMFTFTLRRGRFSRRKDLLSIGERFRRAITAAFRRRLG
jgi:hypothetical protein